MVEWGPGAERKRTSNDYWKKPLRWQKKAVKTGIRPKVFCASLADVFDEEAPVGALDDLMELITMTPNLDWQVLTKRPTEALRVMGTDLTKLFPNIWLGVSAEDQDNYNSRWTKMCEMKATKKFISYEPALGPINIEIFNEKPDWLICGGESGPGLDL